MKLQKKYDLICSLGGNCSAAHNLRYRGMRKFSLPFDWLYINSMKPIEYLSEGFKDNFENFCKKENLKQIEQNNSHMDFVSYADTYTGYYFVNHFTRPVENTDEFEIFNAKNQLRIKRLLNKLSSAKSALFILNTYTEMNTANELKKLNDVLKQKYPNLSIDFYVLEFQCNNDEHFVESNITINKYKRTMTSEEFHTTSDAWDFLGKVGKLELTKKYIKRKIKKIIKIVR